MSEIESVIHCLFFCCYFTTECVESCIKNNKDNKDNKETDTQDDKDDKTNIPYNLL